MQIIEIQILFTTSRIILGLEDVEALDVAKGNVIRAKRVGTDILAGLRNLFGGELIEYTKLMSEAREQANDQMIAHAEEMGANAIIGMRFATSMVAKGAAEILAYGTAVKFRRIE